MRCSSSKRNLQLLLVAGLSTAASWTADNSFVGDWKLNSSRSKYTDVMKVESLGANKYQFDFGGGPETIVVDGTDQSGVSGTMLSVTVEGPDSWRVVRKQNGRVMLTASWKLSKDGNTLTDNFTAFAPTGTPSTVNYLYKRTASGTGFAGTWESPMDLGNLAAVLNIRPYEENGLSFMNPLAQVTKDVKFDGQDYPTPGPGVAEGSTSSARRVDERTLEITDKIKGKITRTEQFALSPDLKTLTETVRPVGQRGPNIFVFERQ